MGRSQFLSLHRSKCCQCITFAAQLRYVGQGFLLLCESAHISLCLGLAKKNAKDTVPLNAATVATAPRHLPNSRLCVCVCARKHCTNRSLQSSVKMQTWECASPLTIFFNEGRHIARPVSEMQEQLTCSRVQDKSVCILWLQPLHSFRAEPCQLLAFALGILCQSFLT